MLRALAIVALMCAVAQADDKTPAPTGQVTKTPQLIQAVAPEYPPAALAAGKTAAVKVRIHIDAGGIVTAVDVLEPVGDGFDEAAVAAAMQYIFDPAEIDGKPAAIQVETTINFVIDVQPVPDEPSPDGKTHAQPSQNPAQPHAGPPNHAGPMDAAVSFQGVAVERGTRKKLSGVIVSISELGLDAVTGDDGSFYFHGVPAGSYKVIAVDDRYDRLERPIEIAKRETVEVRLWMKPRGGNPYETVVEGEKEVLEVTKRTISRQQMTSIPGTFGDPIRVIQTLPGVQRAPFGLGLLLVRGSNPDDTGIFIDGHEVPALFHFLGGPSIFNAEMLDSLDLYPGGFSSRFGRHHGGVVALELRDTKDDGIHGSAKVDFIDAGGYLRAPITKDLSVAVAGRRSYIDLFLGFVLPDPGPGAQRIVTPVYDDLSAKVDYNLHADGRLSLFYIRSHDGLHVLNKDLDTKTSDDLNSSINFYRVLAKYTRPLGGDLKLTVSPSYGVDTVSFSGAQADAAGPFSSVSVVNKNLSYRMRINGRVGDRFVLDTGIDLLSRVTSYQALVPVDDTIANPEGVNIPTTQLFRGSQMLGAGIYLDLGIDLTKNLRIVPNIRGDAYVLDGQDRQSIDPRLNARYRLDDAWTLKAYIGRFSQPPQPEALDRRFGNTNVQLEHGYHYGVGYEWKPSRLWSIDSEVYYVDRRDLVVFTEDVEQNPDGTFSFVNFRNTGSRESYGLEAIIKREISEHFYAWLSYTFSRSKITSDHPYEPVAFDQPHVMNAVASWKPGGGWELGARFQFSSGRPDTPVIGSTFDADTGTYEPVRGPARSIREPAFRQLDVRAEKDWTFQTWSIGLYLDIINVLNTKNVEAIQYDYRFRESSPITSFPFLPTLGVRGTW